MTEQHPAFSSPAIALVTFLSGLALSACSHAQDATSAIPAAWSAPASVRLVKEEKTFENGPVKLSGTLYLAGDRKSQSAIVVTHAAGSPLRDLPLYKHLKEMLPSLGVAVLIYDRRGSGEIAASAPFVSADVQMVFRSVNSLRVHGYPQAEIDQMIVTRNAVDDYMRGTSDRATAQRLVDVAKAKPWFKLLYMSETVTDRATSRWRKEIEFDPLRTLDAVKIPALIVYGAADPVVPVAASVERLRSAYPKLDVAVIAGADHAMQVSVPPQVQMDPARMSEQAPDAAEYFAVLASWLTRQAVANLQLTPMIR
jgi:pimeloyl-ACP methyl ester carboxylesterase